MQSASSIAQRVAFQPSIKSSSPLPIEKLPQPLMDKLALKMSEIYGHRWTANFGVSFNQDHAWASALSGVTGQQLAVGLMAVIASGEKWPPSAPEFRALCEARPTAESLGLPTEDKAFAEAVRKTHPAMAHATWSHDAVYHAAAECGFYNLQTLQQDASRKLFARNYAIALRMVLAGEPLKAMPLALPATTTAPRTAEVGNAALAGLRALRSRPVSG